jgi:hypothetical protein
MAFPGEEIVSVGMVEAYFTKMRVFQDAAAEVLS